VSPLATVRLSRSIILGPPSIARLTSRNSTRMFCLSGFKVAAELRRINANQERQIFHWLLSVSIRVICDLIRALPFPFYISRRSRLDDKVSGILL
jgi:hypothetical protein